MRGEIRGREALERRVEIGAQIGFDPLGGADDRKPGAEPRDRVGERETDDRGDEGTDRGRRRVALERFDRALDDPRDPEGRERRGDEARAPERVAEAIAADVARDRARRSAQPDLPEPGAPMSEGLSAAYTADTAGVDTPSRSPSLAACPCKASSSSRLPLTRS